MIAHLILFAIGLIVLTRLAVLLFWCAAYVLNSTAPGAPLGDSMTDAPWNGIDALPQSFDPAKGSPVMLECMVPFYEMFIPFKCAGDPGKLKAALEAIAQRNTFAVEDIINPLDSGSRMGWIRAAQAAALELTEEEEEALLRELGFDVGD